MKKKNVLQSVGNLFSKHPHAIGESYFQHLGVAMLTGLKLVWGGLACILHSIFPFIFADTASNTVRTLAATFERRNQERSERKKTGTH